MYSDVFCKVYNEFGWNYYPEIFGEQLLQWLKRKNYAPKNSLDLGCGTGVLCRILQGEGIRAAGMDFSSGMIDIARQDSPEIPYEVADMITYRPEKKFDLVTCTGDALNHIRDLNDIQKIFQNVYAYTSPGGYFVFDILNEHEVSTSEPFEMDFTDKIRVFEDGQEQFEENIRETVHDPEVICNLLKQAGFQVEKCADRLLEDSGRGTTWFVVARKS